MLRFLVEYGHWAPATANLVGAALAVFSNYNFNNIWTFKEKKAVGIFSYFKKMLQFYLTSSVGILIWQTGTIYLGDVLIGRDYYLIYFLVGTFILMIWNFTIYNKLIWKDQAAIV